MSAAPAKPLSFNQWYSQLQALADERNWDLLATEGTTKESWKEYWEDGDAPEAALLSDMVASGESRDPI